jgi:hypothetical protein
MSYIPGDCKPKRNEIEKGTRKILDAVMNGKAFKNPTAGTNASIGGFLNSVDVDGPNGEAITQQIADIQNVLSDFNAHTNKLSGKGSTTDFQKIFGIASAYNDSKESIEKGTKDHFKDMFGGLVEGTGKMEELKNLTAQLGNTANETEVMGILSQAQAIGNQLTSLKNRDDNNLNKALGYVLKKGLGDGIASATKSKEEGGNCFGAALFKEFIASDELKSAIAVNEQPRKVHDALPDISTVDMSQIEEPIATTTPPPAPFTDDIERRFSDIENALGMTTGIDPDTPYDENIDGGSYGASS